MGAKHWHEYAELAGGPPGRKKASVPARSDSAVAVPPTRLRPAHELASLAGGLPRSKRPGAIPLPPARGANGQRRARHAHEYAEIAGGPPAWAKDKKKKVACPCEPVHSVFERRTRIGRHAHDFAELVGGPVARKPKAAACPCDVGQAVTPRPPARFEREPRRRRTAVPAFSRSQARWLSPGGTFVVPRSLPFPSASVDGTRPAGSLPRVEPLRGLQSLFGSPFGGARSSKRAPAIEGLLPERKKLAPRLTRPPSAPLSPGVTLSPPTVRQPGQLTLHPETQRLRIATFNAHLVPREGYDGLLTVLPSTSGGDEGTARWTATIAKEILAHKDDYDVIVFNEVFSEPAQELLVDLLKGEFPHWIVDIRSSSWLKFQDSGLAVFSRYAMAPLLNGHDFQALSSVGKIDCPSPPAVCAVAAPLLRGPPLAFEPYAAGVLPDALADKGIALVRVDHAGRSYFIAFTHLQADYPGDGEFYPSVRRRQLAQVGEFLKRNIPGLGTGKGYEVVVLGDLNVEGWIGAPGFEGSTAAAPNARMLASEYGTGIWSQLGSPSSDPAAGLPFYDAWRTTSPEDHGQTHRFPGSELGRLDYALLYGGGYHQPGAPTLPEAAFMSPELHDHQCPQWVRRTLQGAPSDHVGVLLELGPRAEACRPDYAVKPAFPVGTPDFVDRSSLDAPGQVRWYRVDAPGTYSIGLLENAADLLAIDVFPVADLSTPIPPISRLPPRLLSPWAQCKDLGLSKCRFVTRTYFLGESPFYVRVSAPSGRVTGETAIFIRKHDCSSEEDGCWLSPGQPLKEFVGEPGQLEFYFPFRTHASFDERAQNFEVEAVSSKTMNVTLSSVGRGKLVDNRRDRHFLGRYSEGKDDTYMLHVGRAPSPSPSPISVAWRTNLTYLFGGRGGYPSMTPGGPAPLSLYCVDETGGDTLGNDEVLLEVGSGVGAAKKVHFRAFWPDVNAGDAMTFADMPPLPLVGPAKIWISELT